MGAHRIPLGPTADLRPRGIADLVGDFIDALELHDAVLVGNDTGGAVAQLLIAARPEVVAGVALVSCDAFDNFPPGLPGRTMNLAMRLPGGLRLAVSSLRFRALRRLPMTFGWMTHRPIDDDVFERWLSAFAADRQVRRDLSALLRGVDRTQLTKAATKLKEFTGEALVVWAADDKVMPLSHADELATALGGAPVEWIAESRTLIPLDQPRQLAGSVRSLLHRVQDRTVAASDA